MFDPNHRKELFRIIVTKRLDDAPVGPAKGELIEELAENLTCRYQDMVDSGMDPAEAESRALDALGDTTELVDYLKSLEPDQPLPDPISGEKPGSGPMDELLHNVEELIRGTLRKARTAISDTKEAVKETLRTAPAPSAPDGSAPPPEDTRAEQETAAEAELEAAAEAVVELRSRVDDARSALAELEDTCAGLEALSDRADVSHALSQVREKLEIGRQELKALEAELYAQEAAYDILESRCMTLEERREAAERDADKGTRSWQFSMGYDSDKGKFYAGKDRDHGVEVGADDIRSGIRDLMKNIESLVRDAADTAQAAAGKAAETVRKAADTVAADAGQPVEISAPIAAEQLRGICVETFGGDITLRMTRPADGDVIIDVAEACRDRLEVLRSEDGVLTIRPVRTETFTFFSRRGMGGSAVDITLELPCRDWDFWELSSTGGDVALTGDHPVGRIGVHTVSGDVRARLGPCPRVSCRTTGGDIRWSSSSAEFLGETVSGDIRFDGTSDHLRIKTTSGDVELEGAADQISVRTVSGDIWTRTDRLPSSLAVNTVSGDVKVDLPDEGPFAVRFSSTSGDFSSDFFTGTMGGRSCRFSYQGGGDREYGVTTVSGDLELRKA